MDKPVDKPDIAGLAELARLELTDEEKQQYETELADILGYVEQVREAVGDVDLTPSFEETEVKNILRDDTEPHATGVYTRELLAEAPRTKDDFVQVKKILSND